MAAGAPLDVDRVAEELRRSYREYQRIKTAPFRALVARAVQNVRGRADRERAEEPQSEVTLRVSGS